MKMLDFKWALSFAVASMLFPTASLSAESGRYTYRDPIFPKRRLVVNVPDQAFQVADVALPMTTCKDGSRYICVESDGFNFHVPAEVHSDSEWHAGGVSYKAEPEETISLLGKVFSVRRINGKGKNLHILYLYSVDNGLVGFSFVDDESGAKGTYLLDQACGFGAKPDCKEIH
jgi:hypothetical protein